MNCINICVKKHNKYEERNSFPYGETIAHDERYVINKEMNSGNEYLY